MKTQLYRSIIALFFLGTWVSCTIGTKEMTKNDISFDVIQVDKTYHLLDNPENPNCNLQINFTYPTELSDKEMLEKVQKEFVISYFGENYGRLSPQEAVDKYTEDYLNAYKELEADFKQELQKSDNAPVQAWYSYYEMSSIDIVFNEADLLSYTVNFENYTGGAHGSHSFVNHVISLQTGEPVTEEEIFVDNYQDTLAQILVDQIAEQNNVEEAKELENIGFFSIDEIFPNGNFLVDETGITYYFNEYEIAAYVVGMTKVHLPFSKINYLLKEESPISILFKN